MEHDKEQERMSTGKKVVAGAAVGLAVPAAVGVAKKLLSDGDDGDASQPRQGSRRQSGSRARPRSTARSQPGSARGKTRARSATSGKRSSLRAKSRSTSSRRTSGSSAGSERTKEQLYNQAKRLKIEGRSSMTKAQLERAIGRKRS